MIGFKKFVDLNAQKKCPPGYKFDEKLGVCVPKGKRTTYYPYYGLVSKSNGDSSNGQNGNANGNGNGNGNGSNGNGNGANGGNGGNGNGGNGS